MGGKLKHFFVGGIVHLPLEQIFRFFGVAVQHLLGRADQGGVFLFGNVGHAGAATFAHLPV